MRAILSLLLATVPTVASAQTPVAPMVAAVEPARLAAAKRVVDTVFPVAQRQQMTQAMVESINQTMLGNIQQQPDVARALATEPRARPILERFVAQQQDKNVTSMKANLPGMVDAMARAYARRFTVPQLDEMQTFFQSATGQVYIVQSMTIMSDPDVAAWQAKVQSESLAALGSDVRQVLQELMALAPASKAKQ